MSAAGRPPRGMITNGPSRAGARSMLKAVGFTDDDLRKGATQFADPQTWAEHLVRVALERGSRDNVTCIVVAFDPE